VKNNSGKKCDPDSWNMKGATSYASHRE